jgi:phosphatidylglycerol:prolipoprotein diacylglycerol transferase
MLPIIQLGPLALQVPGLVLLAGLWLGLSFAEKRARRSSFNPADLYNMVFIGLIAGVIGARLSYAATFPGAFSGNLLNLVSLNPGLLDPFAGLLIAAAAIAIYMYRKHLPFWGTLDNLTFFFAVMAIAIGISHLASGNAFGKPTDLPWGIHLWGATRHPSQIYEIILATLALIAVLFMDKSRWVKIPGIIFLVFISLTALSRLFLEAFRGDSFLLAIGFRLPQVIAWVILAVCLGLIGWRMQQQQDAQAIE